MIAPIELSKVLDRGGNPTVRELLSSIVFNPSDGMISLNGARIVMQRTAVSTELRRELIRMLGPQEARVFLIRIGFLSGQSDARFCTGELAQSQRTRRLHSRHPASHVQRRGAG
ncbi:XylR N-terminal domain-containing protein (plasmid) [Rhizobium sp. RCAM05350]|nr:XylR N-terminal domain-containing protein [Rhizobium sp. RCAM05350]